MSREALVTPANAMTALRPIMGLEIANRLRNGETGAIALMMAMTATDAEGQVARVVDRHFPDSGRGSTNFGTSLDPIADTGAFMEVSAGALLSPRISHMGKLAVGIVLASESIKSVWAYRANKQCRDATGENLIISPSRAGKRATAAKFLALTAAVATHDLQPGKKRKAGSVVAITSALAGAYLGERARRAYARDLSTQS